MYEKVIGDVKGVYDKITLLDIVLSIFWIVCGVLFASNSNWSNQIVSVIVGVIFLLNGLSSIYSFVKRGSIILFNLNIIYGTMMIVLGILSLVFMNVLQVIIGIYFIILGLQKVTYGYLLKKYSEQSWLLTIVVGLLFLTMGIISFFTDNLVAIAGIVMVGYGVINIVNVILLRKRSKFYIA